MQLKHFHSYLVTFSFLFDILQFRGSGNVVLQENVKNIMERKEDKRIDIRRNEPREIPHKNNKEKATEIFRPHMSP